MVAVVWPMAGGGLPVIKLFHELLNHSEFSRLLITGRGAVSDAANPKEINTTHFSVTVTVTPTAAHQSNTNSTVVGR